MAEIAHCGEATYGVPQSAIPSICKEKKVEENTLMILIANVPSVDAIKFTDAKDSRHVLESRVTYHENGSKITLAFESLDAYNEFVLEQERG